MVWPSINDYQEAVQDPKICFSDPVLKSGFPELDIFDRPKVLSGTFACVFQINNGNRKFAARCFQKEYPQIKQRYQKFEEYFKNRITPPYMVDFKFLEHGIIIDSTWYPVLKMEWISGDTLNSFVLKNKDNLDAIKNIAEEFNFLTKDLFNLGISHGDLHHGNLLVNNGSLRLIDYDGMYVPGLEGTTANEFGNRNYQHPNRSYQDFGPYIDNFSALVIYLSLLSFSLEPSLFSEEANCEESLFLGEKDFKHPSESYRLKKISSIKNEKIQSLLNRLYLALNCTEITNIPSMHSLSTEAIHIKIQQAPQTPPPPKAKQKVILKLPTGKEFLALSDEDRRDIRKIIQQTHSHSYFSNSEIISQAKFIGLSPSKARWCLNFLMSNNSLMLKDATSPHNDINKPAQKTEKKPNTPSKEWQKAMKQGTLTCSNCRHLNALNRICYIRSEKIDVGYDNICRSYLRR